MSGKSHELVYFDLPGRGEATRIFLTAAGVDFTDTRVPFSDWREKVKPTTPLGSLPVLKIDGKEHVQSNATARYAAKLAGCYPEDPIEALKVDEVCDTINEIMVKLPKSDDVDECKKLRKEYQDGHMHRYASFIDGMIKENGGTYVSGNSMTLADLVLAIQVHMIEAGQIWDHVAADFYAKYEGIMATVEAVRADEKVVAYYDSKK